MSDRTAQPLFEQLIADPTLDAAYKWHSEAAAHAIDWAHLKDDLRGKLASGEYAFHPLHRIHTPNGSAEMWEEADQIVLKAMTLVLQSTLGERIPGSVYGVRGTYEQATARIQEYLAGSPDSWVMKGNLSDYFGRIDQATLYSRVAELIHGENYLLRLVWQYLHRSVEDNGDYEDIEQGIARDCPLSPLMAALYLKPLDELLEEKGGCYVRFMDQWVALFQTNWSLRRAAKEVESVLGGLSFNGDAYRISECRADKSVGALNSGLDRAMGVSQDRLAHYATTLAESPVLGARPPMNAPRSGQVPPAVKRLAIIGAAGAVSALPSVAYSALMNFPTPIDPTTGGINLDGAGGNDIFGTSTGFAIHLFGAGAASHSNTAYGKFAFFGAISTAGTPNVTSAPIASLSLPNAAATWVFGFQFGNNGGTPSAFGWFYLNYNGAAWSITQGAYESSGGPITVGTTAIPEPSVAGLGIVGALLGGGAISRRRRKEKQAK